MAILLNIRANYLATVIEVVSKLVHMAIRFLMRRNARNERRRALHRHGYLDNVMRQGAGVREQVRIARDRNSQWTLSGRVLSVVSTVLFALSFVTAPTLQSQIDYSTITDQRVVGYRKVFQDSFCRNKEDQFVRTYGSERSIIQTYEYAVKHGVDVGEMSNVPRVLDVSAEESIYANDFNNGTRIMIVRDEIKTMDVFIDSRNKLWKFEDNGVDLIKQWEEEDGYRRTGSFFQKVNATFSVAKKKASKRQLWESQDADAMVGVFFQDHVAYRIAVIDTRAHRRLRAGTYRMSVRVGEVRFSDATPWPDTLQELLRVRLYASGFDDARLLRECGFVLGLHWASVTGTTCRRDLLVPKTYASVAVWAFYWGVGVAALLCVVGVWNGVVTVVCRRMPDFLDDAHRALSSCYRQVNGLGETTRRTRVEVRTVRAAEGGFRASWTKGSSESVVVELERGQFLTTGGEGRAEKEEGGDCS